MIQLHIYTFLKKCYFPVWFTVGYWIQFYVLYSRTLLCIHPVCCCCCSVAQLCLTLCDPMACSTPGLCPSPSPEVCPGSCPLHQWCRPAISFSDALFSFCPHSFPASGTFPMSQLFSSDDQNTGASPSASVLPTSIPGWFPLRLTGLISLQSKGTTKCQLKKAGT